jgi:anti-sigma factor RsiW
VSCDLQHERIHALLDGELPPAEVAEVERHIRSCPACSAAWGRLRALRAALRTPELAFAPPAALEASVRGRLEAARGRTPDTRLRPLLALAASVLFGVAIGRFLLPAARAGAPHASLEALVDAHVRALASGRLIEVASSDRHTVKPWFAGRVPFSPAVKDLASEGFPLVGGRVDSVSGSPTAVLVYGRARHVIEVFVRVAGGAGAGPSRSEIRGFHVVRWTQGDLEYEAVSDLNAEELGAFVALLGT